MKSIVILFTIILTIASKCYGVPPSPNDRLWDEITSAKNVMANIAGKLYYVTEPYKSNVRPTDKKSPKDLSHIER